MTQSPEVVRTERSGASVCVVIDNPPVNAMSHAVRLGLKAALEDGLADGRAHSVILIGSGRAFVAGADITEFGRPRSAPLTPDLIALIEAAQKPVIAALHGAVLGGGLELAMGCHYRIAAADSRLGQPEVKLGLLPGAGGTQRLPRLVGIPLALEMIAGGEPITARQALEAGLVDELAADELRQAALAYAERLVRERAPLRRVRDLPAPDADRAYVVQYRGAMEKRRRGVIAPLNCIAAVEAAAALPFDQGLAKEQELFQALVASDQSKAQRYFFFAEREAGKVPGLPANLAAPAVKSAAVIGAGTMGGGIAMCFANAGIPVTLIEASRAALDRGLATVRRNYEGSARSGGLGADEVARRMALITPSLAHEDAGGADVVIEAVFEDLALKQEIFRTLDRVMKEGALLATNTSYQDVNAIAAATGRPERVLGLHFFSPANVMRLVEVVRANATATTAVAQAMSLARRLRKVPVAVGVCYGFVGNRMLAQRSRGVERLLLEGALPHEIDAALTGFGFPMGPCAAADLAGLDNSWRARQAVGAAAPVADALCEAGRFGQKAGAGYYRYEPGSRTPHPDPAAERIILAASGKRGSARRAIAADEIVERTLLPMVNEGARILAEGIALRASDIDVIWAYGYGFPVHRGGPMFWADAMGLATVAAKLAAQAETLDDGALAPAALLCRLAAEGRGFT